MLYILIVLLVAVVAFYIIGQMGLDAPQSKIARIIVGVILLVALIAPWVPGGHYPYRYGANGWW